MLTVVVPIYNVEKYLDECLMSIQNQTFKDFEVILVNDGSTDSSPQICEKYVRANLNFRMVSQKNAGLSAARNTGIRVAKGDCITFVDSDDILDCEMLSYLYDGMIKHHADISLCQYELIDEDGEKVGTKKRKFDCKVLHGREAGMKEYLTTRNVDTVAWGKLYKLALFSDIRYPVGKFHEDVFTTYKLIDSANVIFVGGALKYLYRQRRSSISNRTFSTKHLDAVEGNIQRATFINKKYPELNIFANAGIVYAANQCVLKLIAAKLNDDKVTKYLQDIYRRYEGDFLHGKSGLNSKVFSIAAWVNLRALLRVARLLKV